MKKRIYQIKFELKGLVIEHEGALSASQEMLCAAAGPAMGLIYAYFASFASTLFFSDFFGMSSGISLTLSFFNALPVRPLDGAVMMKSFCILSGNNPAKVICISGIVTSLCLLSLGIYLMIRGMGYGLIAMSIILMLYTLFEEGIVKKGDLR